jgi:anti-sigma regulatory factor (Ser/Thr protein kinase)
MADGWPLHTYLELGALPSAVPCARLHARQLLWEWGLAELSDNAELLISELCTNALTASRAMKLSLPIRLWLLSDKARVMILVWDGNPEAPVRMDTSEEAESGRGLVLVEALSDEWNWYVSPEQSGKVVWCQISIGSPQELSGRDPRAQS